MGRVHNWRMKTHGNHSVGILADDLTSAADGASPFVMRGLTAWIGRAELPGHKAAVISVDSGSRSMSAEQAARRTGDLAAQLSSHHILYKTVDSTLRGHLSVELEAAFHASGRKRLVFAPAFPAAGRTTVGGVQYVNGVGVSESVYGRDPVHPARTSLLADLVPLSISDVVMLDAMTQEDLDQQIAALTEPESILWVGSPGMAQALARTLATGVTQAGMVSASCSTVLVAIGSANPISHLQADRVEETAGVTLLRAPCDRASNAQDVLTRTAQAAASRIQSGAVDLLVATGGDTMEAILDRLNVRTFLLFDELEPGFPLGRTVLADGRTLLIAMKAGGFGDEDTLRRAISRLRHDPLLSKQVLS